MLQLTSVSLGRNGDGQRGYEGGTVIFTEIYASSNISSLDYFYIRCDFNFEVKFFFFL